MRSEKMGNFKLQLIIIKQMLPYFQACEHFNYPKSAQLYVQEWKIVSMKWMKRLYHMHKKILNIIL